MTAITYTGQAPVQAKPAPKAKVSIGTRLWNAFIEAQTRRAMREIRMHRHLLPADLEIAGTKISYKNEDTLPFVRTRD